MAAFNWISFNNICPNCAVDALLRAQCHVASTFGGEQGVRFCNRTYRLNEAMLWWPREHPRWEEWVIGGEPVEVLEGAVHECCHTECMNCGASLYAIIEFRLITPTSIVQIGLEKDWPPGFLK